ncbi:MAG: hypothetical protein KA764_14670, partial [Anaerolineales bacterium]|nr:hypothetical protein [Anaerolineales bacterium]
PDLQRAAELDPADAETQYTLARARWANAEPQAALDPASRAVELAPAETSYWAFRAQLQASLGDYIAAGDDLTQALKVETDAPAQAVLLAKRAYLHRLLNAPAAAQADADQALALAPAAALARVMAALARDTAPAPADLAAARAQAPADDLLWQGIVGVQP